MRAFVLQAVQALGKLRVAHRKVTTELYADLVLCEKVVVLIEFHKLFVE